MKQNKTKHVYSNIFFDVHQKVGKYERSKSWILMKRVQFYIFLTLQNAKCRLILTIMQTT